MADVLIQRGPSTRFGMFGRLYAPGGLVLFTGELAWHENRSNISAIPPSGAYRGVWEWSNHFKRKMYGIYSAPGRAGLRMHPATFMGDDPYRRQLNGCIALSEKLGRIDGQPCLLVSRPAVTKFENLMAGKSFSLEVRDYVA